MKNRICRMICLTVIGAALLAGCGKESNIDANTKDTTVKSGNARETTTSSENKQQTSQNKEETASKEKNETAVSQTQSQTAVKENTTDGNTVSNTASGNTKEDTSKADNGYTNKELCEMARNYYKNKNGAEPPRVVVDSEKDGMVLIHLFESTSEHDATWDWYSVDRRTGKGTDILGEPVNLAG